MTQKVTEGVEGVLDRNSIFGKKNDEFSFSIKLMCLENIVVFYSVFSFKS